MEKLNITITNEVGLHARPASMFTKTALKFESDITIIKDNKEFLGKSILQVLSMGAKKGDIITIIADGTDETQAIADLKQLINNNFGE